MCAACMSSRVSFDGVDWRISVAKEIATAGLTPGQPRFTPGLSVMTSQHCMSRLRK